MSAQLPWSIQDARDALADASRAQSVAETQVKNATKKAAEAWRSHDMALAQAITRLRSEGVAAAIVKAVAQGDPDVSGLRFAALVADGVREAATQASWRANHDRKDAQSLAEWSMKRELAEGYAAGGREPAWTARAAA